MDSDFWIERWHLGHTAFDQGEPHRWLDEHWPSVAVPSGSTIFVPLCGKSVDMVWLADQGYQVVGVELSALAVESFFDGQRLEPKRRAEGKLEVYSSGPYELWCGDLFHLPAAALAGVSAVYDRASLVALPPEMRSRYIDFMVAQLPPATPWFLITFGYDQTEMDGPPFSVPLDEVHQLFGQGFDINTLVDESVIERAAAMRDRGLSDLAEALSIVTPTRQ